MIFWSHIHDDLNVPGLGAGVHPHVEQSLGILEKAAAYAGVLRHNGFEIGKKDYLGKF